MYIETTEEHEINYCDASGLNCFARCPAKYFFERILGLRDPGRRKLPLDYGTIFHHVIPIAYHDKDEAKCLFHRLWKEFGYDEEDKARNTYRAELSIDNFYFSHQEGTTAYTPLEPPAGLVEITDRHSDKEVPFLIDIGADLPFAGRIDRNVTWNPTDKTWPLDYKTGSEVSPRLFGNFDNCLQVVGYTLADSQILGERVPGLIIELIRVSPARVETMLKPIIVSDMQLEWFIEWTKLACMKIVNSNQNKKWRKNMCACAPYSMFGSPGFTCDYKILCQIPDWTSAVKFFKKEIWHPINLKGNKNGQSIL